MEKDMKGKKGEGSGTGRRWLVEDGWSKMVG